MGLSRGETATAIPENPRPLDQGMAHSGAGTPWELPGIARLQHGMRLDCLARVNWEWRLREMLLAGGSLAAVACGSNAHESPVDGGLDATGADATASDDGDDGDGGVTIGPSFCCNANPDPCCYMACPPESPDSSDYVGCEVARSACEAHWGSYGTLDDGGFGCEPYTVPSNFTFNAQGEPSCGAMSCNLGPTYETCCLGATGDATCVDAGAACPPGGSAYECVDSFECSVPPASLGTKVQPVGSAGTLQNEACCAVIDETTATVTSSCQSTLTSPLSPCANVAPADAGALVSVQICVMNESCFTGERCIWQDCTVGGQPIQLTLCGVHGEAPLNCTPHLDAGVDMTVGGAGAPQVFDGGPGPADISPALSATITPTAIVVDPMGWIFVNQLPNPLPTAPPFSSTIGVYGPANAGAFPAAALTRSNTGLAAAADGGATLWAVTIPVAIAVDGQGHLLVANAYETADTTDCSFSPPGSYGSDILVFDDDSSVGQEPSLIFRGIFAGNVGGSGTPLSCLTGMAVSPANGDIFVTTASGVQVLDLAGQIVASAPYPSGGGASGVAVGPSGTAYVADGHGGAVYEYQLSATSLTLTGTIQDDGGPWQPQNVAVDGSGNVYVADWVAQTVNIYSATGVPTGQIAVGCQAWLTLDSAGQLYTSCSAKGIEVFRNEPPWTIVGQYGVTPL